MTAILPNLRRVSRRHGTSEGASSASRVRKNCDPSSETGSNSTNFWWLPACATWILSPTGDQCFAAFPASPTKIASSCTNTLCPSPLRLPGSGMAWACHPRAPPGLALLAGTMVGLLRESPDLRCPPDAGDVEPHARRLDRVVQRHRRGVRRVLPHERGEVGFRDRRRASRPGEVREGGEAALPVP